MQNSQGRKVAFLNLAGRCGAPYSPPVHQLAQVNVARLRRPLDDPSMREFVVAFGPVERLAAVAPGFVWRLTSDGVHGVCVQPETGGPIFVNLTVWRDYDALHQFVYRSPHAGYLKRRSRWFDPTPQPSTALWWVPAGSEPTVDDALRRLRHLRDHGPSARAFSLRRRFTVDGRPVRAARRGGPAQAPDKSDQWARTIGS